MLLRKLNPSGLAEFERYISDSRNGSTSEIPLHLATEDETSELLPVAIEYDDVTFSNRYEMGQYLVNIFDGCDLQGFIGDIGFWSALSLIWFDQLCPLRKDKRRNPSMVYNYILSENYNHRPRHAIFTTWQLVDRYSDDARFLLCKEMSVRGELIEQIMARQYFLSCEGVMRAASSLYYDESNNNFKRGAAARKSSGCVYRYIAWLQQLELTYDLFSVPSEILADLMPSEFDRFKTNAVND